MVPASAKTPSARICSEDKDHAEALGWLQQSKDGDSRALDEQDPGVSLALAKDLYQSGATRVHASAIERAPGLGQTSNTLIVELPQDPEQRSKLSAIEARIAGCEGFEPVPDEGQHYMFLHGFKLTFWQIVTFGFGHKQKPRL